MIKVTLEKGDVKVVIESDKDDVSAIVRAVAEALNPAPYPYYYIYNVPGMSTPIQPQITWGPSTTSGELRLTAEGVTDEQLATFRDEWQKQMHSMTAFPPPNCS